MPPTPPPPVINVSVEIANEHFYMSHYMRLEAALLKSIPDGQAAFKFGRPGAYEVTVDDRLVYSKLKRGYFPKEKEVLQYCEMIVKEGREPEEIPRFDYIFCSIL